MISRTRSHAAGARRAAAWLAVGVALASCQSFRGAPDPDPAVADWRVVERLGDARFLPPGASPWTPAIAGTLVPAASQVTTGKGGRVILARAGSQISAAPGSEFTLPGAGSAARLEQHSGRLRFRIADAGPEELAVRTPFLGVLAGGGAFEVLVSATATEVTVETGTLRVVTPDGARQASLVAGQSVYAAQPLGRELAVHLPHDRALESAVVPAMRPRPEAPTPDRAPAASSAADRASEAVTPAPAPETAPTATPSLSIAARADVAPGNAAGQRRLETRRPSADAEPDVPGADATPDVPGADRPGSPYERLTHEMVRGLPAAAPVPVRRPARTPEDLAGDPSWQQ
jgi:FecR protein